MPKVDIKLKKNKAIEVLESELFYFDYKLKVPIQGYQRMIIQKERQQLVDAIATLKKLENGEG